VSDFKADWSGTGGSLKNLIILHNDGPGMINAEASSASLSNVTIVWNAEYLANGNTVTFPIESDFPEIHFDRGFWTRTAPTGRWYCLPGCAKTNM
jgi:hypothetical protein